MLFIYLMRNKKAAALSVARIIYLLFVLEFSPNGCERGKEIVRDEQVTLCTHSFFCDLCCTKDNKYIYFFAVLNFVYLLIVHYVLVFFMRSSLILNAREKNGECLD